VKGGESWRDVYDRCASFLAEVEARYRNAHIFVAAHASSLLMLSYALTKTPLPRRIQDDDIEIPYATLLRYEPSAGGKAKFTGTIPPKDWVPRHLRKE